MDVSYRKFKKEIYRELAEKPELEPQSSKQWFQYLLAGLKPGQKFLDLGCGAGDLLLEAQERIGEDGECWGIDISVDMLDLARDKAKNRKNIHLKQTDVTWGLPFADNTFDLVVSNNVLQEIPSVSFLAEEIYRVTARGGKFRLAIPCLAEDNQASRYFSLLGRKYFWYFHTEKELRQIFWDNELTRESLKLEFKPNSFSGFPETFTTLKEFNSLIEEFQAMGYRLEELKQGLFLAEGKRER